MSDACRHSKNQSCKVCSPVNCEKCGKTYSVRSYKRHEKTCKNRPTLTENCEHKKQLRSCKICLPNKCEKCNKIYCHNSFKTHKCGYVRPPKKVYECLICSGSSFRDNYCLKRHYKGSPDTHKELLSEKEYIDAVNYWKERRATLKL